VTEAKFSADDIWSEE